MAQRLYVGGEQVAADRASLRVRTCGVQTRAVRVGTDVNAPCHFRSIC
jgi:hypothetical protein